MKLINNHINRLFISLILIWLLVMWIVPAAAVEPGWKDVPRGLKKKEGTQLKGEFLFATGVAGAEDIRQDKAHELAKKKSLLRALQLVHMASSCKNAPAGLNPDERRLFVRLFTSLVPPVRVQGLTVIRQWETGQSHFTAVAVPLSALKDVPCEFPDLSTAIDRYIKTEQPLLQGLAFCLQHAHRYSRLYQVTLKRVGRWYEDHGIKVLARCFLVSQTNDKRITPVDTLVFQNRLAKAASLTGQAEKHAVKGNWDAVLDIISQALNLVPTYSRAYMVLADYFMLSQKNPAFALRAAEKAMQDGTYLEKALNRKVQYLKLLHSPEKEAFQFMLSRFNTEGQNSGGRSSKGGLAGDWANQVDWLTDFPVSYQVFFSAGQAVDGAPKAPDAEFGRAVAIYNQAKTDEDVDRVLDLLFSACENQPASPKTYNLIGACYRHIGKPEMALPFLWQALTLESEYDFALTNLALCCHSLGLEESASYYIEHEAVKDSKNKWVQESYARFFQRNADTKKSTGS